ncbi:MAG TPA: pyrroloquinoline quinone-dependent dehydrogenase [Casimicrobiaceae bacterium]|nr:pyrroloquinoline quinone-dependent dehydrogenase [Casimicrobiaceae bacterium]
MPRTSLHPVWVLPIAALIALGAALFDYFWSGNGIHGTAGVLLVIASSAAMLILAILLVQWATRGFAHGLLLVLLIIDIAGTALAAWFLQAWWILGATVLAAIGWLIALPTSRTPRAAPAMVAVGVVIATAIGAFTSMPASRAQDGQTLPPAANASPEEAGVRYHGWYTFNGDLMDQKFSQAAQITPQNVARLQKAWEVHTGDVSTGDGKTPVSDWSATPLFVNDTVYVSTPFYRIFALTPDTGKVKWTFDTHAQLKALTQPDLKTRGVAYWQAATPQAGKTCQKIVYLGTMEAKLYAVDADTGKPCDGFGSHGVLDINQWNTVNAKWPLSILQPPTVYKDTLYIGWAGKDWAYEEAPPGTVFAVDAQTGKLKWTFDALPKDEAKQTGTSNVWASMSIDPEHGILYLPISSPSPNFWGGNRKEKLPLATSVTALDADSGKVLWSRQIVHHDIWDYDTNSPPTLVDLHKDGKTIPALVQSSKMGFFFVLNRLTGEPIYPIDERKVPASDVPGEQASPTQPYPETLEPTVPDKIPGIFKLADWAGFGECSDTLAKLRHEGRYTPPSVQGTLAYPSTAGGVEWGGGAVDPRSGVYVVNSSAVAQIYRLVPRDKFDAEKKSDPKSYYAQAGAPYGFYLHNFVNRWGMPCWNPPYGTMSAYDLNTGKLLWRKPFGEVQKWGFYMPKSWGSVTIGGPLITKSGVIFVGGSMDARVRAIDLESGDVLWKAQVDAPAVANPGTYMYKGRQYVVFVVGGNAILKPQVSDEIVAYALPSATG